MKKRILSILLILVVLVTGLWSQESKSIAASTYEKQAMQFINVSNSTYLTSSSSSAESNITSSSTSAALNKWEIVYGGSDYFQIKNFQTGYALVPSGNSATSGAQLIATSSPSGSAQYWKIVSVSTDSLSQGLNYKIVNYANTNLAITLSSSSFILSTYSSSSTQQFRFDTFGALGFAGYSKNMSGNYTASVTGGVLGQTVTVTTVAQLQSYASGTTPYTIVIGANLSASSLTKVTVGKNKTFIGAFGTNTLNNIHFRATSSTGNCIFKNITFTHDSSKNENDDIQMYISSGDKFWIDHCTWTGHTSLTSSDVDKHMYVGAYANFVSVTSCKFMNHKYGLILGYPQDNSGDLSTYGGYPLMTIANNYFSGVVTRAPGLMRYGYFHSYNNYIYDFDLGYTPYTGANVYSQRNYFEKGSKSGSVVNDMGAGLFTDSESVLSSSVSNLSIGGTSWRPTSNYSYGTRTADQAKSWAVSYAGSQSSSLSYPIN